MTEEQIKNLCLENKQSDENTPTFENLEPSLSVVNTEVDIMPLSDSERGGESRENLENREDRDNLDLILDISLKVRVEMGRTKMVVHDLLNLDKGSVIELNKMAGDPMDVFVNDKHVAKGEAVVVGEKFGVRLTEIVSSSLREDKRDDKRGDKKCR